MFDHICHICHMQMANFRSVFDLFRFPSGNPSYPSYPSFALLVNPHRVMACAGVLGLPSVSRVRWKMSGDMKRSLPLLLEAEQLVLMGCL